VGEADVLGVEAPLWTETVTTRADLDLLVFPRLLGHAEVAWSPAAAIAWPGYRRRLAAHGPRLEALGVGYHRAPRCAGRPGSAPPGDRAEARVQLRLGQAPQ
jgi:hexosaminidase